MSSEENAVGSSAYLCILLGEHGHQELACELKGAELVSSVLLVLEAGRNLVRLSRERVLTPAELDSALRRLQADCELFILRELTFDLCTARTMPLVTTPRSLDLGHLCTALWFHEHLPLHRFVTLDSNQMQAARELGLPS